MPTKTTDLLIRLVLLFTTLVLGFAVPQAAWAQASLDTPAGGSFQSGVGYVRGWKCSGGVLTYTIDNSPPVPLSYGGERGDTFGVCGDTNNGFITQQNWGLLPGGQHTIRVFDNGQQFAQATFTVTTYGQEYLTGAQGTFLLPNFPQPGTNTIVQWQESVQNFVIVQVQTGSSIPPGAYAVSGSETHSLCLNPAFNGTATYAGYLTDNSSGVSFSAAVVLSLGDGIEVQASLTGTRSLLGPNVNGSFTANTFVNDVFAGNSTGLFQGAVTANQVSISYNGLAPTTGCFIVGSLQGAR